MNNNSVVMNYNSVVMNYNSVVMNMIVWLAMNCLYGLGVLPSLPLFLSCFLPSFSHPSVLPLPPRYRCSPPTHAAWPTPRRVHGCWTASRAAWTRWRSTTTSCRCRNKRSRYAEVVGLTELKLGCVLYPDACLNQPCLNGATCTSLPSGGESQKMQESIIWQCVWMLLYGQVTI